MPYKSDAQRRWAHTDKGEKALGGPEGVHEWDEASKGKDLPEKAKKMADGGWVDNPDMPSIPEVGKGINEGVNHDLDAVKEFLMNLYNSPAVQNGNSNMSPTLSGLQNLANQASQGQLPPAANEVTTDNGFATGGAVTSPHREKSGPAINTTPEHHYDTGGMPGVSGDDGADFLSKLQAGTAMTPETPKFNPQAGLPPPPPAPVAMPNNDIGAYLSQQQQQIGQYGPEQQMAVSNDILQRQNGLQGRIANAGTGLADALMQGVARAGPSNFQGNLQNRQDKQAQIQLEALKGAREGNVQNVEMKQKLDAMDPNSAQSKAAQASQGLFLSALGFDPKTISKMSAVQIPEAISTIKDLGIKDRELAVAKFKAQIEANALAETGRHNRAEEGVKGQEIRTGELEKAAAVPFMSRVAQAVGLNPAGAKLQSEAVPESGNTMPPDVLKYAATHSITPQQALAIKNKRLGIQ